MVSELDVNRWVRKFHGGRSWNDQGRRRVVDSFGLTPFTDLSYIALYPGYARVKGGN